MVTSHGIRIALRSQYDIRRIPEYSLPNAHATRGKSLPLHIPMSRLNTKSSHSSSANGAHDVSHPSPVAEVYIPLLAGSQFWIVYNIETLQDPLTNVNYYFFKLFAQGRCVLSWGVGEQDGWRGKTVFGLYDGGEDWRGRKMVERHGLHFGSEDGGEGFFELKVYRCRARKRVANAASSVNDVSVSHASSLRYCYVARLCHTRTCGLIYSTVCISPARSGSRTRITATTNTRSSIQWTSHTSRSDTNAGHGVCSGAVQKHCL